MIDLADTPIPSANFASRIGAADAFVVVTPEYNHGYPGLLKTAIDSVGREWHAKPVGFVSYGRPVRRSACGGATPDRVR